MACFAMSTALLLKGQMIPKIVVGDPAGLEQINPYTNFSALGSNVNEYLFFSLLRTDKRSGDFLPILADSLPRISKDKLTYTYTIHPLAKFNSGKKVTAQDVVFSIKALKNPWVNNAQKRAHYENIVQVTPLNDNQVSIRLAKLSPEGLRITSDFAILNEDVFDPERLLSSITVPALNTPQALNLEENRVLKIIAERINGFGISPEAIAQATFCGSYVVMEWKRGEKLLLETNKKFWGKKLPAPPNPFFLQNAEQIEFLTLASESGIREGLLNGRIDVLSGVKPELFFELRDIPRLQSAYIFVTPPSNTYEYIGLNMRGKARGRSGVLDDLQVRKAMSHIVYTDWLLERVRFGLGERIAAECPSSDPDFRNMSLPLADFNIQKALSLLKAAGWKDADDNGLLDKVVQGEEQTMVLECIYNSNHPYRAKIAEDLQMRAREAGILISILELPWNEYIARLKSGDFDMYIGAWVSDPNENSYHQIWHSKNWGTGSNFVGFGNEDTDALVEGYEHTENQDIRKELAKEIQRYQAEMQPYVFLWQETSSLIIKKNINVGTIGSYRPGYWIAEWK